MYHGEPMGHVFHRNPLHSYPVAVAGDGAYLYDREGRRYLDASGGTLWRRRQYEPLLIGATHVSPCYAYRDQRAGESDAAYVERLGAELEAEIKRLGGDRVIAFVAETVAGATLGAAPPAPGYFRR